MQAEKKKLAIVGGLAVVILGVGVFQFTGGSSTPAPAPKKAGHLKVVAKAQEVATKASALQNAAGGTTLNANPNPALVPGKETKVAINEMNLPERDPFDGDKYLPTEDHAQANQPGIKPFRNPAPMSNPPVSPVIMPGKLGMLPPAGSPIPIAGMSAAKPVDTFNYSVSGVVTGDRPAAVFSDAQGNQRLISVGASLDGDTKVVAISRGRVTVNHHGKTMTMTVGADTPTEKRSDEK